MKMLKGRTTPAENNLVTRGEHPIREPVLGFIRSRPGRSRPHIPTRDARYADPSRRVFRKKTFWTSAHVGPRAIRFR
jgi:hypothetical protein